MIDSLLTDIGLSEKESRMYLSLLRHGSQPTSVLAKKAGMNRGTAYVILHSLLSKGLVIKAVKKGIQYFGPLAPEQLLKYIDRRQQELKSTRERAQAMMGQLTAIGHPLTAKPKIEFFEGAEGIRHVLDDTLTSPDTVLRAYLSIADIADFAGADFFYDYTMRRIKAGFTLHTIRTLEKDRQAQAIDQYSWQYITSRKQHREVRHVPDDLAFPVSMYIYGNKIGILSSKEENFALIIESRELADMQRRLFETLWRTLQKGKRRKIS